MRIVDVNRETKETKIVLNLNPDGTGKVTVESGVPFFDHMLTSMGKHGGFDLTCTAKGGKSWMPLAPASWPRSTPPTRRSRAPWAATTVTWPP